MKIFGTNPTLIIGFIAAALTLAGTFGFRLLSPDQAGLWVAAISALAGVATALTVRPVSPAVFTYAVGALVALATAYGLNLSAETVAGINGVVIAALVLLTRDQVSPIETPVTALSKDSNDAALAKSGLDPAADGI